MPQIISKIGIKDSSGTGYNTRDIGAKGQNVEVGYDASGKIILDVDTQTPTTTKQLTKVLQDAEKNISDLDDNKAPDNHAWSDADSGVNHGLADGTHYGHIKTGNGLTNNFGEVSVAYGETSNTACEGNDARLSDARKNPKAVTFSDGITNTNYDGSSATTVTAATIGAAPSGHTTVNATSSILGHVKVGTGITNNSGTISVSYGSAAGTACQGNDSRLSDARPASDVYSWAKASSKPSYSWSEIGSKPSYADQLALSGTTLGSKHSLGSSDGYIDELSFYKGNFHSGSFQGGVSTSYIGVSNELTVDKNGTIKLGDHYVYAEEKGTWTPTNAPGSSSIDTSVYKFKDSEYRKIGDIVILTTTATPTNYETESSAEPTIRGDSFPFSHRHTVSAFAINASGDSSIGIYDLYRSTFNFGTYTFTGASNGITDVKLTIIYTVNERRI